MGSLRTRNQIIQTAIGQHDYSAPLRVGVIYCTSSLAAKGREVERVADLEVVEVAQAVKRALDERGYLAEMVDLDPNRIHELLRFDHIFNLAESMFGFPLTEYEVTERMENLKIGFTGAGSIGLRACLDKFSAKKRMAKHGIPTPPFELFDFDTPINSRLKYPLFVKPVHEDGSIGIDSDSIVYTQAELAAKVKNIHATYLQAALVEEYIEGRDINISILGNGNQAVAFPPLECAYPEGHGIRFMTFATKWLEDSHQYQTAFSRFPSELSPTIEQKIKQIALQAHRIMGCRDYARVDFRLNGNDPFVLEVNPNPCINPHESGFIITAEANGYSYNETINRILECSLKRRTFNFMSIRANLGSNV